MTVTDARAQISDATGFDAGDYFASPAQVREYFSVAEQRSMFGDDAVSDQAQLDRWAEAVTTNRWHCRWPDPELRAHVETRDVEIFGVGSSPEGAAVPLHPESIQAGLDEATARRELAERLAADAAADQVAWARAARGAGWPVADIARMTGLSRQIIYRWTGGR